jgi:hypothetical protein
MAQWLDMAWAGFRTKESFIRKSFDATVLIEKNGEHSLTLKRLWRPYTPKLTLICTEKLRRKIEFGRPIGLNLVTRWGLEFGYPMGHRRT